MRNAIVTLLACTLIPAASASLAAETSKTRPKRIGQPVAEFTLKDFRGKSHSLSDFRNSKLVVIAFLGTECPLAKLYGPRLAKLHAEYEPKGVAFVGINANTHDSITEIAAYARIHKLDFPLLKDLGNKIADRMHAVRTPEVFLLDAKRTVRYWGRIDDQYGVGYIRDKPGRHDLRTAIDELLAGKPVSVPQAAAEGCFIGRVLEPKANSPVTYTKHIAPLLHKRCVECHRKGDIAPFALTKYEEVAGWAETIQEVVFDRRMPPWHADPKHGEFANDRSLSAAEKKLIQTWVAHGAPRGEGKPDVVPLKQKKEWQLPHKPDVVIEMAKSDFTVPAEGEITRTGVRRGVQYRHFHADYVFQQDRWIKMAQAIPGNRAVVHHILVIVRPPGRRGPGLGGGDFLVAYVPGLRARVYPEGRAKFIPKGSRLTFQMHYTPIGSIQKDRSKVGLVFADPHEVKEVVITAKAWNRRFRIPANDGNYKVEATSRGMPFASKLVSMMPHMHLRGKAFSYEARVPGRKKETLLNVPAYDFNWQTQYDLKKPLTLPRGSTVHCVAHFDNSKHNLANPNPNRVVGWGDQTWDEMMIGYFDVVVDADRFKKYLKR